ncbi:MAG: protein kinase, partial [Lentisphaeria bacterium]|nr:protein kinase [Lentisphaeria bacterium]
MDDPNKTMPPRRREIFDPPAERTMPGKRDRKLDGRFDVGDLILGRYKVLSELGQGGMGVVYKCFDETGGIEVALKVMPPELSHNTLEMEDIRDNFQLVAKLVHQNIAISKQLERDNSNGNYYLIMECVEGENLWQWIKQKRRENALTLETVLPVVRQVAEALDYAHEQKIIHRDIKPGNIMIDSAGHVKVLDFGLAAQIHTSMTRISMAYHGTSGTGPYMAPEQWEGRVQGAAADQYALGVMTYEMLAGHLPFESTEAAVLREAVLKSRAVTVEGLPKYVQTALDRVLSKDPSERFDSCSDFTAALARIKVGEIKRKSSKGSWIAGLLLILTAGTGIVFGFFSIQERELLTKAQRQTEERQREEQKTESLYRKGTECYGRKDYSQAAVYFRKAAERGNARAQHNLGDCYDNGKGVEKNHSEAVKWYCKAAEQGDAEAQCALGYCYVCGQGV